MSVYQSQFTYPQLVKLANIVRTDLGDDDAVRRLINGEIGICWDSPDRTKAVAFSRVAGELVDRDGVFIPTRKSFAVEQANFWLSLKTAEDPDYARQLENLEFAFEHKLDCCAAELEDRVAKSLLELSADERFGNLVKGFYACPLVTVVPQTATGDVGTTLVVRYLPALKRAYTRLFPNRSFINHNEGLPLARYLKVESKTGYDRVSALAAVSCVPGIFFPNATLGWAVPSQRRLISTLPQDKFRFSLGGVIDGVAAWIANLAEVAKSSSTPVLDLSALSYNGACLALDAQDTALCVTKKRYPYVANGSCSGGLFLAV